MNKLKGLALGLLMCLIVYFIDRGIENAAKHAAIPKGEAGASAGTPRPRNKLLPHLKEATMRRAFMWYVNAALLIVFAALLSCSITGCAPVRRDAIQPEPAGIVLTPVVQNNLDFLFFAIADKGELEASFCMLGWADARTGTALISRITPVWVDSADNANLHHRPSTCSDSTTIGIVHFHPGVGYCDLSDVDITAAHLLPWPSTGIVCREHADSMPKLIVVFRPEFDAAYAKLPKGNGNQPPRTFTATYRYRRPP